MSVQYFYTECQQKVRELFKVTGPRDRIQIYGQQNGAKNLIFEFSKCSAVEMSSLSFPNAVKVKTYRRNNIYWKDIYQISAMPPSSFPSGSLAEFLIASCPFFELQYVFQNC